MAKKEKQPKQKKTTSTQFSVETRVRVKSGVADADFPDIPLGGWSGKIQEVDSRSEPPTYLILWDAETLKNVHPIYRKRCERDGLEMESMWLGEDDLELDTGAPRSMEQPSAIKTQPLDMTNEEDRIRAVFDLTSDDPLPDVSLKTLRQYHRYLVKHFAFPFPAIYSSESGPLATSEVAVTVLGVINPDDDFYGLFCEVRQEKRLMEVPLGEIEGKEGNPNRQFIEDYCFWFWNHR